MPIGATIPAASRPVSPDRTTFTSPLNPHPHHHHHHHQRPRSPPQPLKTSAHALTHSATPIQTHISNLDKVLLKKPPPSAPTHHPISPASAASEDTAANPNAGGGLFSALNLSSLFSSSRKAAAEDMSPKSLTQLQRLLSLSPRPSPRSSIASNWRDFHGADDWSGLLDPLDENLRRELVRYGDLVQAAYHAFHSNPAASPSRPRHVILPDRSFHVTRSLFATSSVELPRWVESAAAAPWLTQRSSWIGYVAVCDAPREIVRMGRRDIVIALRGTATCLEWAENFRAGLVPLDDSAAADSSVPKVACGFKSLHRTPAGPTSPSLSAAVADEVRRLMDLYEGEELSITITGHSLGAALSLLVADDLTSTIPNAPPIAVYSFGGPRVGNRAFADRLKSKGVKVLRVVNADDVITRVPGVLPAEEIGRRLGGGHGWASHVLESIDGYSHVGTELRVDSRASPFLRPGVDPNCSHDLEAYLHLVDGFMGSDCPFRSDAKRSLVRLLNHQRANVKPLYVSKAMDLGFNPFEPARVAVGSRVPGFLASPPGYLASPPGYLASPSH